MKVSPKKKKPSESISDENNTNVNVPKTDATALSFKRGKEEAKADALAKAKAWKESRTSKKTANSTPQSHLTSDPLYNITGGNEKADALANAKAWNDARASKKTPSAQDEDCAQDNFAKALKAMSAEVKENAAISPRRSNRRKQ